MSHSVSVHACMERHCVVNFGAIKVAVKGSMFVCVCVWVGKAVGGGVGGNNDNKKKLCSKVDF